MPHKNNWNKEMFSFTKSEIRGLIVLLTIIIILIIVRIYLQHSENSPIHEQAVEIKDTTIRQASPKKTKDLKSQENNVSQTRNSNFRSFNPNKVSLDELLKMGFKEFPAENIVKYREKGGVFHHASDLLRIYGMDSEFYNKIKKYILITDNDSQKAFWSTKKTENRKIYNLNKLDTSKLQHFKGIGSILAKRIVQYRNLLGGYVSINQLHEVYGLPDSIINRIGPELTIDTSDIQKIDLNHADFNMLCKHPYLNKFQAKSILAFRKYAGHFNSKKQLLDYYLLPDSIYRKIAPYLALK